MLDPRLLGVLEAVIDTGSVTAAAARLGCVQSNVSQRLKRLEETAGAPLIRRAGGRLVPTALGRNLAGFAPRFDALIREMEAGVREHRDGFAPLKLGSIETVAATRLPGILSRLRQVASGLQTDVETGTTDHLVARVASGALDVALVVDGLKAGHLVARALWSEKLVLVAQHGAAREETTLVAFREGCRYREQSEALFAARYGRRPRICEMGTIDGILGCVAAGLGVSALPMSVLERTGVIARGEVTAFINEAVPARIVAVWREGEALSRGARALIDAAAAKTERVAA